jgi:hypothetical protein
MITWRQFEAAKSIHASEDMSTSDIKIMRSPDVFYGLTKQSYSHSPEKIHKDLESFEYDRLAAQLARSSRAS